MPRKKPGFISDDPQEHLTRLTEAYKRFFDTEDGRVIWQDMVRWAMVRPGTKPEAPDPNEALYAEGKRAFILRVMHLCNAEVLPTPFKEDWE